MGNLGWASRIFIAALGASVSYIRLKNAKLRDDSRPEDAEQFIGKRYEPIISPLFIPVFALCTILLFTPTIFAKGFTSDTLYILEWFVTMLLQIGACLSVFLKTLDFLAFPAGLLP